MGKKLDGEISLFKFKKDGRSFTVVVAEHFSQKAAQYFNEIAAQIINPKN